MYRKLAAAMQGVPAFIVERQLAHLNRIDPAYGDGVRSALGRDVVQEVSASTT